MDIETFNKAKELRKQIEHISVKISQVMKMKSREDDEEFTICRQLAHDAMEDVMNRHERDFNAL